MFPDPFDTAWWLLRVVLALALYSLVLLLLLSAVGVISEAIVTLAKKVWKWVRS